MDFKAPRRLSKAVPGKFNRSGRHSKHNCLQDRANSHMFPAWQFVQFLNNDILSYSVWLKLFRCESGRQVFRCSQILVSNTRLRPGWKQADTYKMFTPFSWFREFALPCEKIPLFRNNEHVCTLWSGVHGVCLFGGSSSYSDKALWTRWSTIAIQYAHSGEKKITWWFCEATMRHASTRTCGLCTRFTGFGE